MSVAYDHAGAWTVEDVLALDESNSRYELLDGVLMMSPAPAVNHQRASRRLANLLEAAALAADARVEVLEAVNVIVPSGLFVPDLVVVDAAATAGDPVALDSEAVQLIVEIVSPSNKHMDRSVKPGLYAEAEIPHFWRLELAPSPQLIVLELVQGRYKETAALLAGAEAEVALPFPVRFDPAVLSRR
ncbi:Uma2 family endonuclease [Kitasatospora sp. NPDC050543]|uniref:Uma2 family endonuclease n=1 Tax=Kitasatospora sp. NPDC050543 TaxID=3364054 RepID=UPI0037AC01A6